MDTSDPYQMLQFTLKANEAGALFQSLLADPDLMKQVGAREFEIVCLLRGGLAAFEAGMSDPLKQAILNALALAYALGLRDGAPMPEAFLGDGEGA